jgi:hypothetical protein
MFEFGQSVLGPHLAGSKEHSHKFEHFWLCGRCAATMTLELENEQSVVVVSRKNPDSRWAVAS